MKKIANYLPITVAYFYILLYCYAAISKILDFENFQIQLAQSPLISRQEVNDGTHALKTINHFPALSLVVKTKAHARDWQLLY